MEDIPDDGRAMYAELMKVKNMTPELAEFYVKEADLGADIGLGQATGLMNPNLIAPVDAANRTLANPYVQGTFQVIGGTGELLLAYGAAQSGVASPAAPFLAVHGVDSIQTGIRTLVTGKHQESVVHFGLRLTAEATGMKRDDADAAATLGDVALTSWAGFHTGYGIQTAGSPPLVEESSTTPGVNERTIRARVAESAQARDVSRFGEHVERVNSALAAESAEGSMAEPPPLPAFDGVSTQGILMTNEGQVVPLQSGGTNPAYRNYAAAGHVEGKAAIWIRENGSTGGVVYHNNTNGTCGFCNLQITTLLSEGAKFRVVPPENAVANNSMAQAGPTEYVGNARTPKLQPLPGGSNEN